MRRGLDISFILPICLSLTSTISSGCKAGRVGTVNGTPSATPPSNEPPIQEGPDSPPVTMPACPPQAAVTDGDGCCSEGKSVEEDLDCARKWTYQAEQPGYEHDMGRAFEDGWLFDVAQDNAGTVFQGIRTRDWGYGAKRVTLSLRTKGDPSQPNAEVARVFVRDVTVDRAVANPTISDQQWVASTVIDATKLSGVEGNTDVTLDFALSHGLVNHRLDVIVEGLDTASFILDSVSVEDIRPRTKTVCPAGTVGVDGCDYIGGDGLQQALEQQMADSSESLYRLVVRSGLYERSVASTNQGWNLENGELKHALWLQAQKGTTLGGIDSAMAALRVADVSGRQQVVMENLEVRGPQVADCMQTGANCPLATGVSAVANRVALMFDGLLISYASDGVWVAISRSVVIHGLETTQLTRAALSSSETTVSVISSRLKGKDQIADGEIAPYAGMVLDFSQTACVDCTIENFSTAIRLIELTQGGSQTMVMRNSVIKRIQGPVVGISDSIGLVLSLTHNVFDGHDDSFLDNGINASCAVPAPVNANVSNNIFYSHAPLAGTFVGCGGFTPQYHHNVTWASGENNGCGASNANCTVYGSQPLDPLFENAASGDYRLKPGSQLLHAGDPSTKDPDGNASSIGLYGGQGACVLASSLTGC